MATAPVGDRWWRWFFLLPVRSWRASRPRGPRHGPRSSGRRRRGAESKHSRLRPPRPWHSPRRAGGGASATHQSTAVGVLAARVRRRRRVHAPTADGRAVSAARGEAATRLARGSGGPPASGGRPASPAVPTAPPARRGRSSGAAAAAAGRRRGPLGWGPPGKPVALCPTRRPLAPPTSGVHARPRPSGHRRRRGRRGTGAVAAPPPTAPASGASAATRCVRTAVGLADAGPPPRRAARGATRSQAPAGAPPPARRSTPGRATPLAVAPPLRRRPAGARRPTLGRCAAPARRRSGRDGAADPARPTRRVW